MHQQSVGTVPGGTNFIADKHGVYAFVVDQGSSTALTTGFYSEIQMQATNDNGYLAVGNLDTATDILPIYKVSATGTMSSPIKLNTTPVVAQSAGNVYVSIAKLDTPAELYVVVWNNELIVHGQLIDGNGNKVGTEFMVPRPDDGLSSIHMLTMNNTSVNVEALPDGRFVVDVGYSLENGVSSLYKSIYGVNGAEVTPVGTSNAETWTGTADADLLVAGGGADVIDAGAGNDTVVINADNVAQLAHPESPTMIDGGEGVDTLRFEGRTGMVLDLTNATVDSHLDGFEVFDLTGNYSYLASYVYSTGNTLKLNASDVLQSDLNVGGYAHTLVAVSYNTETNAAGQDHVYLSQLMDNFTAPGTWSKSGSVVYQGHTYDQYLYSGNSTLQMLIDEGNTGVVHLNTLA